MGARCFGFATLAVLSLAGCRRAAPTPEKTAPPSEKTASSTSASTVAPKPVVGSVVTVPVGSPVADSAKGSPRRRVGGSPALVLETAGDAVRVLAADGTAGWTSSPGAVLSNATVAWDKPIEAWKYAPEDKRFVEEGADLFAASAGPLSGASKESYVAGASVQAMGVTGAEFLEQPLLSVQKAFVHPLTVTLRFPVTVDAHLRATGFAGVVRPPFLGSFSVLPLAPQAGDVTHVLDSNDALRPMPAASHHWSRADALVIDPAAKPGSIEALAVVSDGGAVAFSLSPKTRDGSFVLPRAQLDSPWLGRSEIADLDGDGKAEWLLELIERRGHGWSEYLVVIAGASLTSSFSARLYGLGGEPGEGDAPAVEYAWWVDAGTLFIVSDRKLERVAWPAGTLSAAKPEITATFEKPEDARADALARGLFAFPTMTKAGPRWAVGRAR